MELFQSLFSSLLLFVYHCFDRIVINGYLSALTRPENAVYFFREVLGIPAITKDVLRQRTEDYNRWVDSYARKRKLPIEKELLRKGVPFRKKDNAFLTVSGPKALQAAADRLSPEIIRNRLEYWTLVVGPKFSERERKAMNLRRFYSEKFFTFLRNELCSNNLRDFGLKKGLEHLGAVCDRFLAITDRFAGYQAQWFNVQVDFPLFQRLALPLQVGTAKFPGIKIQDTRMIRLVEILLHGGAQMMGWRATQIHQAVLTRFHLSANRYGLNQLRYDLRKMKAHELIRRDGHHYTYRLTEKGIKVALLFLLFHKRLCGPLANSLFHHRPHSHPRPKAPLEAAYHKADAAIQEIIHPLKAA